MRFLSTFEMTDKELLKDVLGKSFQNFNKRLKIVQYLCFYLVTYSFYLKLRHVSHILMSLQQINIKKSQKCNFLLNKDNIKK